MLRDKQDWIHCGTAESVAKALYGEDGEGKAAFSSLLELACEGIVSSSATQLRVSKGRFWNGADHEILEPHNLPSSVGRLIFRSLRKAYSGNLNGFSHCCFKTGTFRFCVDIPYQDSQSYGTEFVNVEIFGLRFLKSNILHHFGQSEDPESSQSNWEQIPEKASKRPGRTKGSGSFEKMDLPLAQEMHEMIVRDEVSSPEAAAFAVADRAHGSGTLESKRTRLAKRYRAWRREAEPIRSL